MIKNKILPKTRVSSAGFFLYGIPSVDSLEYLFLLGKAELAELRRGYPVMLSEQADEI